MKKGDKVILSKEEKEWFTSKIKDIFLAKAVCEVIDVSRGRITLDMQGYRFSYPTKSVELINPTEKDNLRWKQFLSKKSKSAINSWKEKDDSLLYKPSTYNTNINTLLFEGNIRVVSCCSLTKNTLQDLTVYIPKLYLNHFGYTLADLKKWIIFLRKCFGFKYQYKGLSHFENIKGYISSYGLSTEEEGDYLISHYDYTYPMVIPKKNYYSVEIKANDKRMFTYFAFIGLRYIYNHKYYNIPRLAMKIKESLQEEVTYLEALLMAHLSHMHDPYYAYLNNLYVPDMSIIKEEIFTNLLVEGPYISVNNCFRYTKTMRNASQKTISSFFENEDYKGFLSYLKSIK